MFSTGKTQSVENTPEAKPSRGKEIVPSEEDLARIEEELRQLADDRDIDELLLTNPLEYEQRLASGELEGEGTIA